MPGEPGLDAAASFVVLPDHAAARAVTDRVGASATVIARYPSGRPWLMGRPEPDDVVVAEAGRTRLAVIGRSACGVAELARWAAGIRDVRDADGLARRLVGSAHLVAAVGTLVRVQGTVSGVRRVFWATVAGVPVAASRADVLAAWSGGEVDVTRLAAGMLFPSLPHPVGDTSLWRGVTAVPGDHYLLMGDRARTVPWWRSPEPSTSVARGAPALAQALHEAVRARVDAAADGPVGADLSGGMDSTSLCFVAARTGARLVTCTATTADVGNDDLRWAEQAATHLPGSEGLLAGPAEIGGQFDGFERAETGLDEPFREVRARQLITRKTRLAADRGARVYLSGMGGDEVARVPSGYLHGLVRRRPRQAVSHLRANRALFRWTPREALAALLRRDTWRDWLLGEAGRLTETPPASPLPGQWGHGFRMPPWVTAEAATTVRDLLRGAASDGAPLADDRGQHRVLEVTRGTGARARLIRQFIAPHAVSMEYPFLDDRVIEACLAVRLEERGDPWRYKPLLVEAMRGTVPDALLTRTTKGHAATDVHAGIRRNRAAMLALCDDSALAALGLVDAAALRTALLGPLPPRIPVNALSGTLAAELWLRTAVPSRTPAHPHTASPGRTP
ncbi:asparagine synthase-related protein [Streptomyces sp. B6B3]|uniref:asparagine synthase-related protein n=1 Tax=Streptomyces sp. B6B3 TaxID=3153570 RepID=UPI00325D6B19